MRDTGCEMRAGTAEVNGTMATKPKMVPAFQSEEEELRFWDEHDPWEYIIGPADITIDLKRRPEKNAVATRHDEKRPVKV